MKQFLFIFLALMSQNIYAQYEVRFDQYGNMQKGAYTSLSDDVPVFDEAKPLKVNSNQIQVQPINNKTIQPSKFLKAGNNYFMFEVVDSKDENLIGCPVACQIIEMRKSNMSGLEGRLILRPLYVEKDSVQIPLVQTDIVRRGLNRTNVKMWTLIPVFIPGSGAKIRPWECFTLTLE